MRIKAIFIVFLSDFKSFVLASSNIFVGTFLNGQHLIIYPFNSYLNYAQPFLVSQPMEFVLQPKIIFCQFFEKLIELSFKS